MATQPAPAQLDLSKVVAACLKIRDARHALSKKFDADDEVLEIQQKRLEGVLLHHLNTTGTASVRTDNGTFFRQEEIKPSCQDWNAYYEWIADNNTFEGLEKRVTKSFIKTYMDENDNALPPGISVHKEFVVRVRKPA
jgi:hypothetical protein